MVVRGLRSSRALRNCRPKPMRNKNRELGGWGMLIILISVGFTLEADTKTLRAYDFGGERRLSFSPRRSGATSTRLTLVMRWEPDGGSLDCGGRPGQCGSLGLDVNRCARDEDSRNEFRKSMDRYTTVVLRSGHEVDVRGKTRPSRGLAGGGRRRILIAFVRLAAHSGAGRSED